MRYHWGLGVGHVHAHRPRNVGASAIVPTYGHTPGVDEAEDCEELQPELTITGHNPSLPDDSYNMGKTENFPLHIPIFLQSNKNDPAIKVKKIYS